MKVNFDKLFNDPYTVSLDQHILTRPLSPEEPAKNISLNLNSTLQTQDATPYTHRQGEPE